MTKAAPPATKPQTLAVARTELHKRIIQLDAAGEGGFEGLVRDAMAELTGQPFHIAKSGPQGGSDLRSAPGSNALRIGVEGKRYRATTALPVDQLLAKIVDAAHQPEPVDLWILAATRAISIQDREALDALAEIHGLDCRVLDWPTGKDALPDLAVLLAATPGATASHLGEDSALATALETIRHAPDYDTAETRLRRDLLSPEVGYAATAAVVAAWLREAQSSERNAHSRLGGYNNLLDDGVKVTRRPALYAAIDAWWDAKGSSLALIGDEGMGKTWTALGWCESRRGTPGGPTLTVFLPARRVQGGDPEALIADALAAQTGRRDGAFWRKRLRLWKRAGPDGGRLLIVIDGLNQNWMKKDWADLLQPLFEDGWDDRVSVLMTAWPETWQALGNLTPLRPEPSTLPVPPFSDEELTAFLDDHGCQRSDFGDEILELMSVPRLSLLAMTSRQTLEASGDVTAERLVYEDWRHRLARGSASPGLSDEAFKTLVSELGALAASSVASLPVSRRELLDRLGRDSGAGHEDLSTTLADLVAGRWFEPTGPHHFRIKTSLTPFALGLALAAELQGDIGEDAARARIAEFIDPLKGQSLGAATLRAATTAALLDSGVHRPARRALVVRWLGEQNFSNQDFQAWWRILGSDASLFCDLAEDWWLDHGLGGNGFTDEVLIKGFAKANEFTAVSDVLQTRLTTWLGWVWPDPEEGKFLGRMDPATDRSQANRRRVIENLAAWRSSPGAAQFPVVEMRDSGDVSWLCHRAVGILSYVPLAPFAPAIIAWALSRAVLGDARHYDEMAWVLRLNDSDRPQLTLALGEAKLGLLDDASPLALTALTWLLQALGDEQSSAQADTIGSSGSVSAPRVPRTVRFSAEMDEIDPDRTIETPVIDLDPAALWSGSRQQREADLALKQARLALARAAPDRLQSIFAGAVHSAEGRSMEDLDALLQALPSFIITLSSEDRDALATVISGALDAGRITDIEKIARWKVSRLMLRMWGRTASEQWRLIAADGPGGFPDIVTAAAPDETPALIAELPASGSTETMASVLAFLQAAGLGSSLKDWPALAGLIDDASDAIRRPALEMAAQSGNPSALERLAQGDWRAQSDPHREDRGYGSLALSTAADTLARPELLARVADETWSVRLRETPDDVVAQDGFHAFLRRTVEDLGFSGSRSFPQFAFDHVRATELLIERRTDDVLAWLNPWLDARPSIDSLGLHDGFPLIDLCRALFKIRPEIGGVMWQKLMEGQTRGFMKNAAVRMLPLAAPSGSLSSAVESDFLAEMITDDRLRELTDTAIRLGRGDWLAERIRSDAGSTDVARIARAWRLLGYADAVEPFESLWAELDPVRPRHGWLVHVRDVSRAAYDRNKWAQHWYATWRASRNGGEAHAAFLLLAASIDSRARLWIRPLEDTPDPMTIERNAFWDLNVGVLEKRIKARKNEDDKTLFAIPIMKSTHAPWL